MGDHIIAIISLPISEAKVQKFESVGMMGRVMAGQEVTAESTHEGWVVVSLLSPYQIKHKLMNY